MTTARHCMKAVDTHTVHDYIPCIVHTVAIPYIHIAYIPMYLWNTVRPSHIRIYILTMCMPPPLDFLHLELADMGSAGSQVYRCCC